MHTHSWQVCMQLYKELNKQMSNTINFKNTWFAEIYKKLPCIFQATNELVFLLVAYKTANKKHFSVKIYVKIRTNVLARNACEYGVTCDTAK